MHAEEKILFVLFLKKCGLYDRFIESLYKSLNIDLDSFTKSRSPLNFIMGAFNWEKENEMNGNYVDWCRCNGKWVKSVIKFNKKYLK
jgi:hypothetical protein